MIDRQQQFDRLVERARKESPPKLDVTEAVMARVQAVQPGEISVNQMLAVCSSLASVAALIAVAAATWSWLSWSDPLLQVFSQAHLVMQ